MSDARELALTIIGLIADGRLDPRTVAPSDLPAPYSKTLELIHNTPNALTDKVVRDTVIAQTLIPDEIQQAHAEAVRFNGLGEDGKFNWRAAASAATAKVSMIPALRAAIRACEANDPIDWTALHSKVGKMVAGNGDAPVPANQIDYKSYVAYMPSGIKWMDEIIGGWPTDGTIVVIAPEGTGKSYFQFLTVCSWLTINPEKTACIYTLEMPAAHYLSRSLEMYPEFTKLVESGRLHISSSVRNADEIAAQTAIGKFGFIGIDDMARVAKSPSPERYEQTWIALGDISRLEGIPVQVLVQTNREVKKSGKFVDRFDAAWSSGAENIAALQMSLNKVDPLDQNFTDDRFVHPIKGNEKHKTPRLYINYLKFRDKRPEHTQQGLGAIRLEPSPLTGFYKQIWVGEAYENKLWPAYPRTSTVGEPVQKSGNAVPFSKRDD